MALADRIEVVIGAILVLKTCLLLLFVRYLFEEISQYGFQRFRVKAAISIAIKEIGNIIVLGWVWVYFHQTADSISVDWMRAWPVSVLGGAVTAAGILYMIRVFTPERCGHASWIVSGVAAIAAAASIAYFF